MSSFGAIFNVFMAPKTDPENPFPWGSQSCFGNFFASDRLLREHNILSIFYSTILKVGGEINGIKNQTFSFLATPLYDSVYLAPAKGQIRSAITMARAHHQPSKPSPLNQNIVIP